MFFNQDSNKEFNNLNKSVKDEELNKIDKLDQFQKQLKSENVFSDSLSNYLKNNSISEYQINLVRELFKQKDPEKAKKLKVTTLSILLNDPTIGVRRIVAWALSVSDDYSYSANLLLKRFKKEKSWIVKEQLIDSLVQIGKRDNIKNETKNEIIHAILTLLNDRRHPIRIAAIRGVYTLQITEAKCKLQEIAVIDPVNSVKKKAMRVLEEFEKKIV